MKRKSTPASAALGYVSPQGLIWRHDGLLLGVDQQAQYPRYAPTATFRQASRRQKGADPQQAGL